VRLDPDDSRSAGFAQVLDGLSRQRLPVYVEVDPATSAITRLLIPLVVRGAGVRPADEGALDVELVPSHARHVLQLGQPDSADLEGQLREALQNGQPVILTEDEAHNIIDIRAFTPCRRPAAIRPRSRHRASFRYPDDGCCWARAHEMCRLMDRTAI
jgi:hypothetical protein